MIILAQQQRRPAKGELVRDQSPGLERISIKLFHPNIYILLQLYGLIPVSVADAERSFPVLKLIKTYLRCTISEEPLNSLAIMSIESEVMKEMEFDNL